MSLSVNDRVSAGTIDLICKAYFLFQGVFGHDRNYLNKLIDEWSVKYPGWLDGLVVVIRLDSPQVAVSKEDYSRQYREEFGETSDEVIDHLYSKLPVTWFMFLPECAI